MKWEVNRNMVWFLYFNSIILVVVLRIDCGLEVGSLLGVICNNLDS